MKTESTIRYYRKKAEISVSELSRRVGVTVTAASNWDHGNSFPRFETLGKVANALGISTEMLMASDAGSDGSMPSVEVILREAKRNLARSLGMSEGQIQLELRILG